MLYYIYIFLISIIYCTYRQDAYHIFDFLNNKELISIYLYQNKNNIKQCSITDGPNCFFISKNNLDKSYSSLQQLYDYYDNNQVIKNKEEKYMIKDFEAINNLYINFESYDVITLNSQNPIYVEPEKILKNKNGFVILYVDGKILLKNDKENFFPNNFFYPSNTYGIVMDDEVKIGMNKIFSFNSLYARCHEKNNKVNIIGFENNKEIYNIIENIKCDKKSDWVQIIGKPNIGINYFVIRGKIEIDNISLTQRIFENEHLSKIKNHYSSNPKLKNIKKIVENQFAQQLKKLKEKYLKNDDKKINKENNEELNNDDL